MASIKRLFKDKHYLRSLLYHVDTVRKENEKKKEKYVAEQTFHNTTFDEGVAYLASLDTINIDSKFKVHEKYDDENVDEDDDIDYMLRAAELDVTKFGVDFNPNSLYYYEFEFLGALNYLKTLKDVKVGNHINKITFKHHSYSFVSTDKDNDNEPTYYKTIIKFVIAGVTYEIVILKRHVEWQSKLHAIGIYRDGKKLLEMDIHTFYQKHCRPFDNYWS